MANPLSNEDDIYRRLIKDKVSIDPDVRELLNHHLRNDINYIVCGIGQYEFVPPWIMEEAVKLIEKLYRESGEPGNPPPDLLKVHKATMRACRNMVDFLNKVMDLTRKEKHD